jgi:lipoprotein Spr
MKKRLFTLSLCFIIQLAVCSFSFAQKRAQLSINRGNDASTTAKVDSFYSAKSIDVHQSGNPDLYNEIYRWYRTKYCYGGNSAKGIDCSHFVNMLYEKVYGKTLGPSAGAILSQCHLLKKGMKKAEEGDILFFKIKRGRISHVGIYLQNGKFAHASTHGVIISDINEPYYKKRFYKVGRVKLKEGERG